MFARRITFRHTAHAIAAAALGAALLAGPAGARPVHGPLLHTDQVGGTPHPALILDVSPARYHDSIAPSTGTVATYHDSIAPSTGTVATYHDSIAPTGSAPGSGDRIAPPTLADSTYRDGSAGPVHRAGFSSNVKGFSSNPKVFAAMTPAGPTGSGSDAPWAAIGAGLLVAALGTIGIVALGRRPHTSRRRTPHGTPSFGA